MDKRKDVSENPLKVRGHVGFLIFSHLQHKIFIAETNKQKLNQFEFFFVLETKKISEKVAKQRNVTWGHVQIFIGDCNIFRFLLPSHKKFFRVPLANVALV